MKTNLQTIESLLREIIKCVEEGGSESEILERVAALEEAVGDIEQNMYKGIPITEHTSNDTISPNEWNVWTSPVCTSPGYTLTITKDTDVEEVEDIVNEYMIKFTIDNSATAPQIAFNGWNLTWVGGDAPTWTAGNTYEISIIDDVAVFTELEPEPVEPAP